MIDIELDSNTEDLVLVDGDMQSVIGVDQICQAIRLTLKAIQGEWFLDLSYGTPWFTRVLGHKFKPGQIVLTVTDTILSIPGVASIIDITAVRSDERESTVSVSVLTNQGEQANLTVPFG